MVITSRFHSVSYEMYICGAKLKKNTAWIFLEIFLIQYFTVQVELFMTSSVSSFAYYKNINISTTKRYSKKENVILLYLEKPLKQPAIIFFLLHRHFIRIVHYFLGSYCGMWADQRWSAAVAAVHKGGKRLKIAWRMTSYKLKIFLVFHQIPSWRIERLLCEV